MLLFISDGELIVRFASCVLSYQYSTDSGIWLQTNTTNFLAQILVFLVYTLVTCLQLPGNLAFQLTYSHLLDKVQKKQKQQQRVHVQKFLFFQHIYLPGINAIVAD